MKSLSEQRRIIDAATPGPWIVDTFVEKFEIRDSHNSEIYNGRDNRGFIASSRTEWPELLSWAERAREAIEDALLNCATAGDWDDSQLAEDMRKLLEALRP